MFMVDVYCAKDVDTSGRRHKHCALFMLSSLVSWLFVSYGLAEASFLGSYVHGGNFNWCGPLNLISVRV